MPYIGNTIRAADDYRLIDDISSSFNGSTTSFALQVSGSAPVPFPKSPQQVLISVNGVIQEPDPTGASGFNLVGTNIVFSSAPTNGHAFFGIIYATADYLNSGGNFPAGSLGAPSITFIGDENTGLYRKGGGSIGFVADATEIANTDSNGITISSGNLILGDSSGASDDRIVLGAGNDIEIYHAGGGNSYIQHDSSGTDFVIETVSPGDDLFLRSADDLTISVNATNNAIKCIGGGAVEIFHNNSKKFETLTDGVKTNGDLTVNNANKLYLENDSENKTSYIFNSAASTHADITFYTAETGGTAANRWQITKSGMLITATDSTYDIGENSNRVRNGYFDTLYGDGSNLTGISSDLVNDTSPQLGGNLASNGNNIIMADNDEIVVGSSNDLIIRHIPGSRHEILGAASAQLQVRCDEVLFLSENGTEDLFRAVKDGAFKAYHDADLRFQTTSSGVRIDDNLEVDGSILGTGTSLEVGSFGSDGSAAVKRIRMTQGGEIHFGDTTTSNFIGITEGTVDQFSDTDRIGIYYRNELKLYSNNNNARWIWNSSGHFLPVTNNLLDIGTTSNRVRNIYTNDLNLSNEGSSNDVDGTWGNYTIQEGFEDLYLINNRTGKKFKFNLTEVS